MGKVIPGALAVAMGLIVGSVVTVFSTPLLWRLEDWLNLELAGHSGPSSWLVLSGGGLGAAVSLSLQRRNSGGRPQGK
jgi:hypothetical protein